jgi:hypothetical protein
MRAMNFHLHLCAVRVKQYKTDLYCRHLHGWKLGQASTKETFSLLLHGITSQKIIFFMVTIARTSNLRAILFHLSGRMFDTFLFTVEHDIYW